jgi:serine/threonine protein kinase
VRGLDRSLFGKYEIDREIGRGAMATVYSARDTFTDRAVAIKIAIPDRRLNTKRARLTRKLFLNEAKAAGLLHHPHIVAVIDAGEHEHLRYIVMELVNGDTTLAKYCSPGNLLSLPEAIEIVLTCAIAFDYAHRKGVIHRDVKPHNILLDEDRNVKISDFGVALLTDPNIAETQVQGYLGSPLYMSPEQLRDDPVSPQSDLFALGIILFEMITGQHPFGGKTISDITNGIMRRAHPSLLELSPDTPRVLVGVIDRLLKKHPAGRYATGLDLAGDLSLISEHLQLPISAYSGTERFKMICRLPFFEQFGEGEIWELLNASQWMDCGSGDIIATQGEASEDFFVLVSGKADVVRDGVTVDNLSAGECFGELAFIQGRRRAANVAARCDLSVLKIKANLVDNASLACRLALQRALLDTTAQRLSRATIRLAKQ